MVINNTISVSMAPKGDFTVTVNKTDVVIPAILRPGHSIPQSNLDLLFSHSELCIFFCYKQPQSSGDCMYTFQAMVDILKESLAQALVSHYALSGVMVPDSLGEDRILCHTHGVQFIEAYADVELQNLNWHNPDQSIRDKLVPYKNIGVVSCYQVTEMKCGGIVVACTVDHRVADAFSLNMFMVEWAEIAKTKRNTVTPSYDRSLLAPRRPLIIDASIDEWYMPTSAAPPPRNYLNPCEDRPYKIYYIEAEHLRILKSIANQDNKTGKQRTTLEAFSAFMWKLVGMEETNKENECNMGIVVNGRVRLSNEEAKESKSLSTYFGNVLSVPYGMEKAGHLQDMPLGRLANSVHNFLKLATTKDHFLNLIDLVESHKPEGVIGNIFTKGAKRDGSAFVVSYVRDFPVSKIDFRWGTPIFGSYFIPLGGQTGYVNPMPSPVVEGDWIVLINLSKEQLHCIDREAGQVLKPMTYDYLNSGRT